jgi:S-adenosylmethionine hydrolase
MPRPVIALLTDFGVRDHYVASMKGVALGICPDATLVDITHDVAPQDVAGASMELAACARFFPPHTVFVVVVDPGVGSKRRAIAASIGTHQFVAPDNGVLSGVLADGRSRSLPMHAVELTDSRYALAPVSATFEGRDRFAPAAAWLAGGVVLDELGPPATRLTELTRPAPVVEASVISGEVVHVDRFGNLITNIEQPEVAGLAASGQVVVRIARHDTPLVVTYSDIQSGSPGALFGSTGHLEIAVNGGNAARLLGAGPGTPVSVVRVTW